jgi:LuxR family transcriptional regulator
MELWKESQLRQLSFARGIDTAYPILENFSKNIGFSFCAVTVASTHHQPHFKTLEISNYSSDWKRQCKEDNDHEADPVIAHCRNSMLPFMEQKRLRQCAQPLAGLTAGRASIRLVAVFS